MVPAGQDINITSPYLDAHIPSVKFFCKSFGMHDCRYKRDVQKDHVWENGTPLLSLVDDRKARVLITTMRNFNKFHAASYWCGVEMNWDTNGYLALFNHVQLTLKGRGQCYYLLLFRPNINSVVLCYKVSK